MLATIIDVFDLTSVSTSDALVKKAQAIVEVCAGRTEPDITDIEDQRWMRYAICWQVAYMAQDAQSVYEQANVARLRQNDTLIDFGDRTYAIAPLAAKAVTRLSWHRTRNVRVSPMVGNPVVVPWDAR